MLVNASNSAFNQLLIMLAMFAMVTACQNKNEDAGSTRGGNAMKSFTGSLELKQNELDCHPKIDSFRYYVDQLMEQKTAKAESRKSLTKRVLNLGMELEAFGIREIGNDCWLEYRKISQQIPSGTLDWVTQDLR